MRRKVVLKNWQSRVVMINGVLPVSTGGVNMKLQRNLIQPMNLHRQHITRQPHWLIPANTIRHWNCLTMYLPSGPKMKMRYITKKLLNS